jgi:hypothetical protein
MTERLLGTPEGRAAELAAASAAKRARLAVGQRAVYCAVLRAFAATGRPPEPAELEEAAQSHGLDVVQTLAGLAAVDVLGLDSLGRIRMAYPFSASPTAHIVTIADGPRVYAMCAIDALGIPAMLHADAVVTSSDPLTGDPVVVTFTGNTVSWHPPSAVAYAGYAGDGGPAEKVSCGYLNFFIDLSSAQKWASRHNEVTGGSLDQLTAQELGAEIFGRLLDNGG